MGAKQKPLDRPTVADLGLDGLGGASAGQKITAVDAAPERAAGEIVKDDGEAARRIVDFLAERKVI
jgi:electron transfer flavoprotein beta subunit